MTIKPTTMLKIYLLPLILAVTQTTQAQNACFNYDAAGNRIQRINSGTACLANELVSNPNNTPPAPLVLEKGAVLVYPNPSLGVFTVLTTDYPAEAETVVLNANGNEVLRRQLNDGVFDLSTQPDGVYYLKLTYPGVRPRTVKLVIVHD
jgi:hypothetical protein